jgi:hypothetical protein
MPGDAPAHQIYIYGGTLQVRFSYFHDAVAGQDFHVRAHDALLEYNFITRPGSYLGDLMSCEYVCGGSGANPITQTMLLRGNVLEQGTPQNTSQLIALFDDDMAPSVDSTGQVNAMTLTLLYNTIIGAPGHNNAVAHMVNTTIATTLHASDNAVLDFKQLSLVDNMTATNWTVDGSSNYQDTKASAMLDVYYVPQIGSPLIGAAVDVGMQDPMFEYMRQLQSFPRPTARDIGAYESGILSNQPPLDMNCPESPAFDGDWFGAPPAKGCSCDIGGRATGGAWIILLALPFLRRRRGTAR